MANESWKNPWKLTAVGMALVIATVLVTGLVVANWKGQDSDKKAVDVTPGRRCSCRSWRGAIGSGHTDRPDRGGPADPVGDHHMQRVCGCSGWTARED
jgi:hypothetical protein